MPKLKRDKSGQRTKEGKEHKESIVNGVTEAVVKYNYAYVFSFENMRNIKSNEIKQQFRHTGRFLLGLKKVIKVGLGGSASDEICPAIFTASKVLLHGDVGLLIMDMPKEEVEKVEMKEVPLEQFTHEMEPQAGTSRASYSTANAIKNQNLQTSQQQPVILNDFVSRESELVRMKREAKVKERNCKRMRVVAMKKQRSRSLREREEGSDEEAEKPQEKEEGNDEELQTKDEGDNEEL
ncbi:hypothetical protein Bca4012_077780 [Brassica carinata]